MILMGALMKWTLNVGRAQVELLFMRSQAHGVGIDVDMGFPSASYCYAGPIKVTVDFGKT